MRKLAIYCLGLMLVLLAVWKYKQPEYSVLPDTPHNIGTTQVIPHSAYDTYGEDRMLQHTSPVPLTEKQQDHNATEQVVVLERAKRQMLDDWAATMSDMNLETDSITVQEFFAVLQQSYDMEISKLPTPDFKNP